MTLPNNDFDKPIRRTGNALALPLVLLGVLVLIAIWWFASTREMPYDTRTGTDSGGATSQPAETPAPESAVPTAPVTDPTVPETTPQTAPATGGTTSP